MKTNNDLGFGRVHEGAEFSSDGGEAGLSINLEIGKRGSEYRAYAYQWHHEQDASREGKQDECAARGTSATDALNNWRLATLRRGWHAPGVEAAHADAIDECIEAEIED